jgi:hypothetical protein
LPEVRLASNNAVAGDGDGVGVLGAQGSERRVVVRWLNEWAWLDEVVGELVLIEPMDLREVVRFNEQKEFVDEVMERDGGFIAEGR